MYSERTTAKRDSQTDGLDAGGAGGATQDCGNSVARMERGEMIVTPPMALLISFVARVAGVDAAHPARGRKRAQGKRAHPKASKIAPCQTRKAV